MWFWNKFHMVLHGMIKCKHIVAHEKCVFCLKITLISHNPLKTIVLLWINVKLVFAHGECGLDTKITLSLENRVCKVNMWNVSHVKITVQTTWTSYMWFDMWNHVNCAWHTGNVLERISHDFTLLNQMWNTSLHMGNMFFGFKFTLNSHACSHKVN